jgi:hypothetical protein
MFTECSLNGAQADEQWKEQKRRQWEAEKVAGLAAAGLIRRRHSHNSH